MVLTSSFIPQRVLTITFNRPQKKNTFNKALWLGYRDALNEARENDHVTVAVLTGAGKDFSAGVDLTDFGGDENEPQPYDLFMEAFCAFDKPLLAAAKGTEVYKRLASENRLLKRSPCENDEYKVSFVTKMKTTESNDEIVSFSRVF